LILLSPDARTLEAFGRKDTSITIKLKHESSLDFTSPAAPMIPSSFLNRTRSCFSSECQSFALLEECDGDVRSFQVRKCLRLESSSRCRRRFLPPTVLIIRNGRCTNVPCDTAYTCPMRSISCTSSHCRIRKSTHSSAKPRKFLPNLPYLIQY
jgi:hypothetical protein